MSFSSSTCLLGCLAISWLAVTAPPLSVADCQRRISHAYDQFEQFQTQRLQKQEISELHFASSTTCVPPGKKKLVTTTAHFVLLSKSGHTYLSNGDIDLYQDGQVQVSVMRAQRTIMITGNESQMPNVLTQWVKMRDQMKNQTTVVNCALRESQGHQHRVIEVRPAPGSAMVGKVTSITYWLDPQTDALQQMIMYYPASYGLHSVSLVLDSQRTKAQDAAVDLPALRQVFGTDNKLLPVYRTFTVQDLRRS